MSYLYEMDEGSEDGTAEHVVFFRLLPKKRKVLNQAAHVWSNLEEKKRRGGGGGDLNFFTQNVTWMFQINTKNNI